jgi:hypothetical protein
VTPLFWADHSYLFPLARIISGANQFVTSRIPSYGSHLEWVTAKRTWGQVPGYAGRGSIPDVALQTAMPALTSSIRSRRDFRFDLEFAPGGQMKVKPRSPTFRARGARGFPDIALAGLPTHIGFVFLVANVWQLGPSQPGIEKPPVRAAGWK